MADPRRSLGTNLSDRQEPSSAASVHAFSGASDRRLALYLIGLAWTDQALDRSDDPLRRKLVIDLLLQRAVFISCLRNSQRGFQRPRDAGHCQRGRDCAFDCGGNSTDVGSQARQARAEAVLDAQALLPPPLRPLRECHPFGTPTISQRDEKEGVVCCSA